MSLLLGLVFYCLLLPPLGRRNGWQRNAVIGVAALAVTALLGALARWWLAAHPEATRWLHGSDLWRLWWLGPLLVVELGFRLGRTARRDAVAADGDPPAARGLLLRWARSHRGGAADTPGQHAATPQNQPRS